MKSSLTIMVLLITLIFNPAKSFSQSQKPGSLEYLKLCNGFKKIILGSDVNLIPYHSLSYLDGDYRVDADSCLRLEYRDNELLKFDDDLSLDLIGIRTYKNKIVNIYLFFKKSDGFKILQNLLDTYGLFTERPNNYMDIYKWNTSKVNLSLMYEANADLGVAIFTCNDLEKEIEVRKSKKLALSQALQLLSGKF